MTLDLIAAFVGVLGALQVLSMLLANMGLASERIQGRARWTAPDGSIFEEFSVVELEESQVLQQDFELSRTESIMARHFAGIEVGN